MTPQNSQGTPTDGDFKTRALRRDPGRASRCSGAGSGRSASRPRTTQLSLPYLYTRTDRGRRDAGRGHARQGSTSSPATTRTTRTTPGYNQFAGRAVPAHRDARVHRAHDQSLQLHGQPHARPAGAGRRGLRQVPAARARLDDRAERGDALPARQAAVRRAVAARADPASAPIVIRRRRTAPSSRTPTSRWATSSASGRTSRRTASSTPSTSSCPSSSGRGDEGYLKFGVLRRPRRAHVRPGHASATSTTTRVLRGRLRRLLERGLPGREPPDHRRSRRRRRLRRRAADLGAGTRWSTCRSTSWTQPDRRRALRVDRDRASSTTPRRTRPGSRPASPAPGHAEPRRRRRRLRAGRRAAVDRPRRSSRSSTSRCAPPTAETVARQTFKELTPILQQEFLGGPIFIGNPELGMSALNNYDLRARLRAVRGRAGLGVLVLQGHRRPDRVRAARGDLHLHDAGELPEGTAQRAGSSRCARTSAASGSRSTGLSVGANATLHRLGGDAAARTRSTRSSSRTSWRR